MGYSEKENESERIVNLYPLNNTDNFEKRLYRDFTILKRNLENLNEILQNKEVLSSEVLFASSRFLKMDLSINEEYNEFKTYISLINEVLVNMNKENLIIESGLIEHPEFQMFISSKDSDRHNIHINSQLAKINEYCDMALFHEITHFRDTLGTKDNYNYTTVIPEYISKTERLKYAQTWTLFYQSAFNR